MNSKKVRFSRKLHLAFAAMLAITLGLAWFFYDSVQWFEYDVERIALANTVLNGHKVLSAQAAQKARLIETSVAEGEVADFPKWQENIQAIRSSLAGIRQAYESGSLLREAETDGSRLEVLDELESLIDQIIDAGQRVYLALQAGDNNTAGLELQKLQASGTLQLFNDMMQETLMANQQEVALANKEAITLSRYITRVLPIFMLLLIAVTVIVAWLFSRNLTRSTNVLHQGARAYTRGDFSHHISELGEREFNRLGIAFNAMAQELSAHRTNMHDSQVRLEAMVEERTRALKSSNEILALVDENRRKLLADISHEFRTPMTVIRGEAEIAMRGKGKRKADYLEALERIIDQVDQTTGLVDDLLFIARADAGEPRLKVRPVSVGSLLQPVCAEFAASAGQREVAIEQQFAGVSATVMGDGGRLRQVFTILIDNALRYSEQGGSIIVSLERGESDVIIRVSDNGIGLTAEESKQAFQRFFRGGKAQTHARGTGLGLPVAKAIVEAHNGSITLEGEPGIGAVATVILPAEDKLRAVA
jgi:signal transduction histidine kinase